MKYIFIKQIVNNCELNIPILFPNNLVHADMYDAIKRMPGMEQTEVVSAGEVCVSAKCSGGSDTLNIKSREVIDSIMISNIDYMSSLSPEEISMLPKSVLEIMLKNVKGS